QLGEILLKHLADFLKLPNRGIKPKTVEDKGGYLLGYTKAPCLIAEPFFIDNNEDLEHVMENLDGLADAYAGALDEISRVLINEEEISLHV
ncbi:MAG: N-acetylmuramoyl-L-alanine amidase, partial [Candidatus Aminicenantes bacterium]|nr:N-acetylmuramoyl-L-alanine amidase [Candidatus Aminicenantes bacterium]